jgi:hypothetical protein
MAGLFRLALLVAAIAAVWRYLLWALAIAAVTVVLYRLACYLFRCA